MGDICKQCGGITGMTYRGGVVPHTVAIQANMGVYPLPPVNVGGVATTGYRLCLGHPTPKHDGSLDAYDTLPYPQNCAHALATIENTGVRIDGGYGDVESSSIYLDPTQALFLLAWLTQEKPTLEQLVKEASA